jgi:SAM-dependent methyltransferase
MAKDMEARLKTVSHYDEAYYGGHYGPVLNSEKNCRLLSLYWRDVLFVRNGLSTHGKVLDYGCGLGQVSATLPDTVCFDVSSFALSELRKRGRIVIESRDEIPHRAFDYLLSSHSLEHSPTPYQDLQEFRLYVRQEGRLVLVLPIETNMRPALQADWNQHLQVWTFQTITNLLLATGWVPLCQSIVYGPFLLRTLGRWLPEEWAVQGAFRFGLLRRGCPSMLTIARLSESPD